MYVSIAIQNDESGKKTGQMRYNELKGDEFIWKRQQH